MVLEDGTGLYAAVQRLKESKNKKKRDVGVGSKSCLVNEVGYGRG
jgi:hypothetical protein